MIFEELPLKGAYVIQPELVSDSRGTFARIFCKEELKKIGHCHEIVQINYSSNRHVGAVRGMHFQYPPRAEIKMVKCIRGAVFDVIIDLRRNSPTFLGWTGTELSENNRTMIYIPKGFAHGFQVLEASSELIYLHTAYYSPADEGALRYNDPKVGVRWPLGVSQTTEKDKHHPLINDGFEGVTA